MVPVVVMAVGKVKNSDALVVMSLPMNSTLQVAMPDGGNDRPIFETLQPLKTSLAGTSGYQCSIE